jgi:hypothetical protein
MATSRTLGGKTEKGLEGIEKSLLKKKSSLAKTRPNFIVRVSPCECESSLRLLPRVVNKICYRIKHACFHSSSHSPRFPSVFLFQSVGDRAFSDAHESGATPSFTTSRHLLRAIPLFGGGGREREVWESFHRGAYNHKL